MSLSTTEIFSDLPEIIAFLNKVQVTLEATKGQSSIERDLNIAIAILPDFRALVLKVVEQAKSV